MTIVHGKIESLKKIRATLNQKGIYRFNSLGDINFFNDNYETEKKEIIRKVESELDDDIEALEQSKIKLENRYNELKSSITIVLKERIAAFRRKHDLIQSKNRTGLAGGLDVYRLLFFKLCVKWLEWRFDKTILRKTLPSFQQLKEESIKLGQFTSNRVEVIAQRSAHKLKELNHIKEVVDDLYPQIAGAIGEHKVMKELEKLSDKHILFNDFSLKFDPPIYNKKEKDRIFSVQIDHLLVTNSGIFTIETKNWSQQSVQNLDFRSPIKQLRRNSFALFVLLNSNSEKSRIRLRSHHWGDKKIPINNLVVMINNKPKEEFKFVKIVTLAQLNRYITYFEKTFADEEVGEICHFLDSIRE